MKTTKTIICAAKIITPPNPCNKKMKIEVLQSNKFYNIFNRGK